MSDRLRLHKLEERTRFRIGVRRAGRGSQTPPPARETESPRREQGRRWENKKRPGWMESLKSARRPVSRRPLTCRVRVQDAAEDAQTNVLRGLQLSAFQRWVLLIPHSQIFSGLPTTTH